MATYSLLAGAGLAIGDSIASSAGLRDDPVSLLVDASTRSVATLVFGSVAYLLGKLIV